MKSWIPVKCQEEDCDKDAQMFVIPDANWRLAEAFPDYYLEPQDLDAVLWLCPEHSGPAGFCMICGAFCSGQETFEFGDPPYYCDECRMDPDLFPPDEQQDKREAQALKCYDTAN